MRTILENVFSSKRSVYLGVLERINALNEEIEGYKLPEGYIINTKENWSLGTSDLRQLLTTMLQCQYENGHVRLVKRLGDNNTTEFCYLTYSIYSYEASEDIAAVFEVLT